MNRLDEILLGIIVALFIVIVACFCVLHKRETEEAIFKKGAKCGAIVTAFALNAGETNIVYASVADEAWKLWKDEVNGSNKNK